MGFQSEARGSKRNKQPSPVLIRLPTNEKHAPKPLSAFPSQWLTAETQNKNPQNKKREHPHFEEVTTCLNCNKIEGSRQATSNSKECARSLQTTHSRIFSKISACHSHSLHSSIRGTVRDFVLDSFRPWEHLALVVNDVNGFVCDKLHDRNQACWCPHPCLLQKLLVNGTTVVESKGSQARSIHFAWLLPLHLLA